MSEFNSYTALNCTGGTTRQIKCDWCGEVSNPCPHGACEDCNDKDCNRYNDDALFLSFGGKTICQCCFDKLASAIIGVLPSFLPEYKRYLKARRDNIDKQIRQIDGV